MYSDKEVEILEGRSSSTLYEVSLYIKRKKCDIPVPCDSFYLHEEDVISLRKKLLELGFFENDGEEEEYIKYVDGYDLSVTISIVEDTLSEVLQRIDDLVSSLKEEDDTCVWLW